MTLYKGTGRYVIDVEVRYDGTKEDVERLLEEAYGTFAQQVCYSREEDWGQYAIHSSGGEDFTIVPVRLPEGDDANDRVRRLEDWLEYRD